MMKPSPSCLHGRIEYDILTKRLQTDSNGRARDGTQSSILLVSWILLLLERKYEDQTRAAGRGRFPLAANYWAIQAIQALQQHRALSCHSQHIVSIVDSRGVASGPRGSRVFHGVPARSCPLAPCKKVPKVPASGGAAEEATR